MKAFIINRYGSKDRVRAGEMPNPELQEDDVLVLGSRCRRKSPGFQNQRRKIQMHSVLSTAAHSG